MTKVVAQLFRSFTSTDGNHPNQTVSVLVFRNMQSVCSFFVGRIVFGSRACTTARVSTLHGIPCQLQKGHSPSWQPYIILNMKSLHTHSSSLKLWHASSCNCGSEIDLKMHTSTWKTHALSVFHLGSYQSVYVRALCQMIHPEFVFNSWRSRRRRPCKQTRIYGTNRWSWCIYGTDLH